MKHDIYIFGSLMRGEVSPTSDVDVLVIPLGTQEKKQYPDTWSVYTTKTVEAYYRAGRLFAWHLHLESKCIYCSGVVPFLEELGKPAPYTTWQEDITDLEVIMNDALAEIRSGTNSLTYELGLVHTAVRDIAMSASWRLLPAPSFSRDVPYLLPVPCPLPNHVYQAAMLARHSSTRGATEAFDAQATAEAIIGAPLNRWVAEIRRIL
jgi:predicted nucleotidyltransferase